MKTYKKLLLGMLFLSSAFVVGACNNSKNNSDDSSSGDGNQQVLKYTVTFNTNGGSEISSQEIEKDGKVNKPDNPTKEASDVFLGWYKNEALTEEFDFDSETVSDNLTLYAKWRKADSEIAMNNFFDRITEPDYEINNPDYLKIVANSEDLVYFDYLEDDLYSDFAVMTVNNEDTFQGFYTNNGMRNITYLKEGKAFDVAGVRLLSTWIDIVGSNIWDCFYNDPDNPLRFTSNDINIKLQVIKYTPYGADFAIGKMKDVVLLLDNEDPTSAIISFDFDDNMSYFEYTEINVSFGNTEPEARALAWMNDPNKEYPEALTDWGEFEFYLDSVFLMGSGKTALPFPEFATYAFRLDEQAFSNYDEIYIRDSRATFQGMGNYVTKLINEHGFQLVSSDNCNFELRLKLREYKDGTSCYSYVEIHCDTDDFVGVTIEAYKTYDEVEYDNLTDINELLSDVGFITLPSSTAITDPYAINKTYESVESLLYLFNYNLVLYVDFSYENYNEVEQYIEAYVSRLENEMNFVASSIEGSNFHSLSTANSRKTFDYMIDTYGKIISLIFKNEVYIPTDEAMEEITDLGFPEFDITGLDCQGHKDVTNFFIAYYGAEILSALHFSITFESQEQAEEFLDIYTGALMNQYGFENVRGRARVGRIYGYYNEELGLLFAFDLKQGELKIGFDFMVVNDDYYPSPTEEDETLSYKYLEIVENKLLLGNKEQEFYGPEEDNTFEDNIE